MPLFLHMQDVGFSHDVAHKGYNNEKFRSSKFSLFISEQNISSEALNVFCFLYI